MLIAVVLLLLGLQTIPLSMDATSNIPSQAVGLALTIIPPKLPADDGTYPAVVISLVDSIGLPSAALSDLTVFLTSSLTGVASVPSTVTITAGSEYVVADATTTPIPGSTTISASSYGLASSYAQLTTVTPSGFPSKLEVFVSPSSLLRRADKGSVRVELVDSAGLPSKAITPVTALLSSSNISVASLDQGSVTISPGEIYATGTFATSANSGQAAIVASSTGYGSGESIVTVVPSCSSACGPSELLLKLVPITLPADGKTHSALEVDLTTSSWKPAVSSSDTIVQLSSDAPDIVSVPSSVTIPAGNISVLVPITTSSLQGHSGITATSPSLGPGNVSVTTVIPAPSELQAYIAPPSTFVSSVGNSPILAIQLQDSSGNPARARNVTEITVTSSNNSMVKGPLRMNISVGVDYLLLPLTVSGSGQSVLTITSPGLNSSQVDLQLARSPLVDQISAYIPKETLYGAGTMYTNGTATITLTVSFLGMPVSNLAVDWTVTGGSLSPNPTKTGASGVASTTFTPNAAGVGNITATASSQQTGPIRMTYLVNVFEVPTATTETSTFTVTSPTTVTSTTTTITTTTVTTTTTASTFAYVSLGAAVVVILVVATLAAWVLRGRRP